MDVCQQPKRVGYKNSIIYIVSKDDVILHSTFIKVLCFKHIQSKYTNARLHPMHAKKNLLGCYGDVPINHRVELKLGFRLKSKICYGKY